MKFGWTTPVGLILAAILLVLYRGAESNRVPTERASTGQSTRDILSGVLKQLPELGDSTKPLNDTDHRTLQSMPEEIGYDPTTTFRVKRRGTIGKYWIGAGKVGEPSRPGVCLFSLLPTYPSPAADCFDLPMISSGRSYVFATHHGTTEIVGIVPSDYSRAVLSNSEFGRRREIAVFGNLYIAKTSFEPTEIKVIGDATGNIEM